jgi:hypothetical protein
MSHPLLRTLRLLAALAALAGFAVGRAEDRDRDGLDDAVEDALLGEYAPTVLLHPSEPALPGSTAWLLARAELEPAPGPRPRVLAASILGVLGTRARPVEDPAARLHPRGYAREGSPDPHDWVVYGHAFRADGGGVVLQYWFFYPFNDAYGLFDHEGDWEHISVKLGPDLRPEGTWYARHFDSHPGQWFAWSALTREGRHPVVLAGRGTHASYPFPSDAPFYDRICDTSDPAEARAHGCGVWRAWGDGAGGVLNLGERGDPRVAFVDWPGRWGSTGRFGLDSRDGPPRGPAFQEGWCSGGAPGACSGPSHRSSLRTATARLP